MTTATQMTPLFISKPEEAPRDPSPETFFRKALPLITGQPYYILMGPLKPFKALGGPDRVAGRRGDYYPGTQILQTYALPHPLPQRAFPLEEISLNKKGSPHPP